MQANPTREDPSSVAATIRALEPLCTPTEELPVKDVKEERDSEGSDSTVMKRPKQLAEVFEGCMAQAETATDKVEEIGPTIVDIRRRISEDKAQLKRLVADITAVNTPYRGFRVRDRIKELKLDLEKQENLMEEATARQVTAITPFIAAVKRWPPKDIQTFFTHLEQLDSLLNAPFVEKSLAAKISKSPESYKFQNCLKVLKGEFSSLLRDSVSPKEQSHQSAEIMPKTALSNIQKQIKEVQKLVPIYSEEAARVRWDITPVGALMKVWIEVLLNDNVTGRFCEDIQVEREVSTNVA